MTKVPLYHGTDARRIATDYLWSFFEPYFCEYINVPLDEPGMDGCTTIERRLIELKGYLSVDNDSTIYNNLYEALLRVDAQKQGNEEYQYNSFSRK